MVLLGDWKLISSVANRFFALHLLQRTCNLCSSTFVAKNVLCTAIIAHHWKMHSVIASILCFWDAVRVNCFQLGSCLAQKSQIILHCNILTQNSPKKPMQFKMAKLLMTRFSRNGWPHPAKGNNASKIWFLSNPPHCATGKTSCRLLRDGNVDSGAIYEKEQEEQGGVEPD